MRGQPDLFGEIHEGEEDLLISEIVRIARKAAEEKGYVLYRDFDEYMEQKRVQKKFKFRRGGWYHFKILKPLEDAGWKHDTAHRPTRFYPPSTESLGGRHKKNQLKLKQG